MIDGQVVHPNLAVASIMADRNYWLRVSRTRRNGTHGLFRALIPHRYIAVRPPLEVAGDFRVTLDILVYKLRYEVFGLASWVDNEMRMRPSSAAADHKGHVDYSTAPESHALQCSPLQSQCLLLYSELANQIFYYVKTQNQEEPFAMSPPPGLEQWLASVRA